MHSVEEAVFLNISANLLRNSRPAYRVVGRATWHPAAGLRPPALGISTRHPAAGLRPVLGISTRHPRRGFDPPSTTRRPPDRSQVAKLVPNPNTADDYFGYSVAISGDYAVAGAWGDDDHGSQSGSAYVFFRNSDGTWTQVQKLTADVDAAAQDKFGEAVAISGDYAVVGAYGDDCDDGSDMCGSAYVFFRDPTYNAWLQVSKLVADDAAAQDKFGDAVAISGGHAVIGAPQDSDGGSQSGSAYVFGRNADESWSQAVR